MDEFIWPDEIEILENAGQRRNCLRCGVECVIAATANRTARPVQHAADEGYCVSCVITQFLKVEMPIEELLPSGATVAEALRLPHVRRQFQAVFAAGRSDTSESQVDWERVIANWDLPVGKPKGRKRRK